MAKKEEKANPLMAMNIPPPPAPTIERSKEPETPTQQTSQVTGEGQEEKATIELSLYLRPAQDDKLEELRRAYKSRTHRKISANEIMRRLIERATLDDIL